jgi:hypothetical protein
MKDALPSTGENLKEVRGIGCYWQRQWMRVQGQAVQTSSNRNVQVKHTA